MSSLCQGAQRLICIIVCAPQMGLSSMQRNTGCQIICTAWILDNNIGQLSGITQDVAWVMTHKIDSQAICRAYNLTWNWNAGIEFIPLAFHLINPNMLFVKITSWKFAMLDKDKNEVTLVYVNIQIKAIFWMEHPGTGYVHWRNQRGCSPFPVSTLLFHVAGLHIRYGHII